MSKHFKGVFVGATMADAERVRDYFSAVFGQAPDDWLAITPKALREYGLRAITLGNFVLLDHGVSWSNDTRVALEKAITFDRRNAGQIQVLALR